ncbi:MAG: penicillin-binding transpeptidase domain-containing protein [Terriglobales bacterium]|jgi:cell division protein FtsI/penicillin-binding protein 2
MGKRPGTLVVVDVRSGRLLAVRNLDVAARRLALPGSAVKPFVLLAALQSGAIQANTTLMCHRQLRLAGRELDCAHEQTAEPLDSVTALAYSCNSFFAQVASRMTNSGLQKSLIHAGFARRTGWMTNEAVGSVLLSKNVEQLQLQALGEANLQVTPLELLAAYRGLAARRGQADANESVVFAGLEAAADYGTARLAQPEGLRIAGKTGTSSASPDEGNWTHAWFAGYAPVDHPRIAMVVFLERGHGGGDAAAAAREVFEASKHMTAD